MAGGVGGGPESYEVALPFDPKSRGHPRIHATADAKLTFSLATCFSRGDPAVFHFCSLALLRKALTEFDDAEVQRLGAPPRRKVQYTFVFELPSLGSRRHTGDMRGAPAGRPIPTKKELYSSQDG